MRNIDEQLNEIMERSGRIQENQAERRALAVNIAAICVCVALIATAALFVPKVNTASEVIGTVNYGSLIISTPFIGYVVLSFLAFVLGILVTLLCLRIKKIRTQ